jgi:Fe-S-cluster-containing dehydrogenase component
MKILWVSTRFTRQEAEPDTFAPDEPILMVDLDRCISCGSCQAACRLQQGGGRARPKGFRTIFKERGDTRGVVRLPLSCRHCDTPCQHHDPDNFWVTCPSKTTQAFEPCDGCAERLDQGLMPACATRCSMKCIYFGLPADIAFALAEKRLRGMGDVVVTCAGGN